MFFISAMVLLGAVSFLLRQRFMLGQQQKQTLEAEESTPEAGPILWQALPGAPEAPKPPSPIPESPFPEAERAAVGLLIGGQHAAAQFLGPTMGGQTAWQLPIPPSSRLEEDGEHVVHLTEIPRPQLPPGILLGPDQK